MKKLIILLVLLTGVFAQAQTTWMVDSLNDSGFGSLRAAADSCAAGDTIRFNPNLIANGSDSIVLTSGEISFDSVGVVIKGLYNSSDTLFISGADSFRIFSFVEAGKVVLDSLVLKNGFSSTHGGAVFRNNCLDTLFILNSNLLNNNSTINGGAIYSSSSSNFFVAYSTIVIVSSNFQGNSCSGSGGGVYSLSHTYGNTSSSHLQIIGSNFLSNHSLNYGGAVYSYARLNGWSSDSCISNCKIKESNFRFNSSFAGGAVGIEVFTSSNVNSRALVNVEKSDFTNNLASSFGAGIYSKGDGGYSNSWVTIDSSNLSFNTTTYNEGGAIYSNCTEFSKVEFSNGTIDSNLVAGHGGGIFSKAAMTEVVVNNSMISNNSVTNNGNGGGVYSHSPSGLSTAYSTVQINNSIIKNNLANNSATYYSNEIGGGGIYNYSFEGNSTISVTESTIFGNTSSHRGAGVFCSGHGDSSLVFVNRSTINGNLASHGGGGIFNHNSGFGADCIVEVNSSTIASNNTSGIYCYASSSGSTSRVNLINSTIYGNGVTGIAPGVYSFAGSAGSIKLSSSIVAENSPGSSGLYASYYLSQGYNILSDSISGVLLTDSINVSITELNLQPLAFNQGSTQTLLPGIGSVAKDNGNPLDVSDAQNAPIAGVRNVGAAEHCFSRSSSIVDTACSYYLLPSGTMVTQSGVFYDTINTHCGADSLLTINITILDSTTFSFSDTVCTSYTSPSGNHVWLTSGIYADTIPNSIGCDSIMSIQLIVNSTRKTLFDTVCTSYTSPSGLYTWTNSGVYMDTIPNSVNCDSIITINLFVAPVYFTIDTITACDSLVWIDGNTYYSNNSLAIDTLVSVYGCDSVVALDLTIINTTSFTDILTACDSLTWIDGITYYSNNNTAIDTIMNSLGCDSIVTLNLTIEYIDSTVIQNMDTLTTIESGLSYQWIDCNSNTPIVGAVSQQFIPMVSGNFKVEISKGFCVDTSSCYQVVVCDNQAAYSFTDNGSGDFDFLDLSSGSYTQIHWSFGDGITSTVTNPNHVYQANGNYVVVLTINDSLASNTCVSYFMDTISVMGIGSSLACQAGFSVYFDSTAGTVNVMNSSVGSNLTYSWGFGDGDTSNLQFPTHSYSTNGPFNLCLTIDNGNGCVDTYCDSISNQGVWFRASGFDLIVEDVEPSAITNIKLSNNINIYPNPVHDQVNIEITNWPTNGVEIVVRDITGKQVYTKEVESISSKETISINTTKWAKGTYFIEVGQDENRVVEKIVVQ